MKVLLCGEGPHDIGYANAWDDRLRDYVDLDGWLHPLIRNALGVEPTFEIRRRTELQVFDRDPNRRALPGGHGAKAYLAKRAAVTGGFDLLIFMVDADSNDVRDWRRIVGEIEEGFALLDSGIRCIACVPMAASESWLLADPAAWEHAFDYDGAGLPASPEDIWGARDDPNADHPHRYFFRICAAADVADDRSTRVCIAAATDLSTARARCSQSLEPFLQALP